MKKAIITGASSGLGKEIGTLLQKNDYTVVNVSRKESAFEDIHADLAQEDISEVITQIEQKHSDVNVLILNAGSMPLSLIGETNFDIDKLFRLNITSNIKLIDGLYKTILKNKTDIVFIGSTASKKGAPEHAIYCATKHAIDGYAKALRTEAGKKGIRVISFYPGGFNSNLRGGIQKEGYMNAADLAKILMNTLELPRNAEVSEIIINRIKEK